MSNYRVVVSRRADTMLVQHVKFLANVSVKAAKRLVTEYGALLDTLEHSPFQFPVEEDYNLPQGAYRKALFCKWYKALFSVGGDRVYLDAILDCRQDNADYQPNERHP
ncbi:hypothetical protein SDC9_199333 [bioreactor metagenome]|uniref:Plasmid stabilization system protein n=1 Tax=bioreactor metagenome TaxID=1076179 RepID=A0A645ITG5_9ZZZZ